jgi:hypothetical protein
VATGKPHVDHTLQNDNNHGQQSALAVSAIAAAALGELNRFLGPACDGGDHLVSGHNF